MPQQTLLWTALPNGIKQRSGITFLQLSAIVSPRLMLAPSESLTLQPFTDFHNWPATVFAPITVQFSAGASVISVEASRVFTAPEVEPDPGLWQTLFPKTTPVRPYQFVGLDKRRIRSYPVRRVLNFLKERYRIIALFNPDRLPPIDSLLDKDPEKISFGPINTYPHDNRTLRTTANNEKLAGELKDFAQGWLFHHIESSTGALPPLPKVPDFDFHDAVSCLGDYPALLRMLGLVLDLNVTLTPELQKLTAAGQFDIAVFPRFVSALGNGSKSLNPRTVCQLDLKQGRFAAVASAGSDLHNGLLSVGSGDFDVVQVDVDGAMIKALDFAQTLARMKDHATADTPQEAGLPALRSAGLAIVRNERAAQLQARLLRATALDKEANSAQAQKLTLFAEDLVRGYRVDVQDLQMRTQPWRSLCLRDGDYKFIKAGAFALSDEGFVSLGLTEKRTLPSDQQPAAEPDLYLHESLFCWDGWSLSAPRPGKAISNPPPGPKPQGVEKAEQVENVAATAFGLQAEFRATSGTLPRLRFGRKYRLRARAVDLAGNSLPLETKESSTPIGAKTPGQTAEITYLRFEPVIAPVVASTQTAGPGESLERLVIRSNFDKPVTQDAARHLAPPKTSPLLAETHGMFDANMFSGDAARRQSVYDLIISNEGAIPDAQQKVTLDGNGFVILPYLPDPLARGAAVQIEMHIAGKQVRHTEFCDFSNNAKSWPAALPWRLLLKEQTSMFSNQDPQKELLTRIEKKPAERLIIIRLRKAEVARLRLSSVVLKEDLELLGIWQWIKETGTSKLTELQTKAVQGQHWMLTPQRELTLVHAVRQPLQEPRLEADNPGMISPLLPIKELNQTFATFINAVAVDGASTGKLDLHAAWSETIDDVQKPAPQPVKGQAHVAERMLQPTETALDPKAHKLRHEFGDTKFRRVTYTAVATSRFREYFESPANPKTNSKEVRLAPELLSRRASTERIVLNSARPAAPQVRYVIPTFDWKHTSAVTTTVKASTSLRRGGGLRVYLERPWHTSGDGEQLAVVLLDKSKDAAALVSQIGQDPIQKPQAFMQLAPAAFGKAKTHETGLTLAELPRKEVTVGIAAHEVFYDVERRLWFCDIEIAPVTSYLPFVRLALARYQPNSLKNADPLLDARLSRVVLTDFAELAPDRTVTVTQQTKPAIPLAVLSVVVQVSGVAPFPEDKLSGARHGFTVRLEKADGHGGELGWRPDKIEDKDESELIFETNSWAAQFILSLLTTAPARRLIVEEYERDSAGNKRVVFAAAMQL